MDRTVVAITGSSSGIGAAFARRLAPDHDLILIARRKERLVQLAAELRRDFETGVDPLPADLATAEGLAAAADRISNEGRLVLLINNAGFGTKGRFWETSIESQEEMHRLHVMATVRLTHVALRKLVAQDSGGIINVASVAAFARSPGNASYSATKGWMNEFTEGLYLDLRTIRSNVTVQSLCPGFTRSEFHDALQIDRERLASSAWWMSADEVVDASLEGLQRRRLFVVPGWRYRLLKTIFSKLPDSVRLAIESSGPAAKAKGLPSPEESRRLAGASGD